MCRQYFVNKFEKKYSEKKQALSAEIKHWFNIILLKDGSGVDPDGTSLGVCIVIEPVAPVGLDEANLVGHGNPPLNNCDLPGHQCKTKQVKAHQGVLHLKVFQH